VELNAFLTQQGDMHEDGSLDLGFAASDLGWTFAPDTSEPLNVENLVSYLCDPGLAVIAQYSGHFVVVTGHEWDAAHTGCMFRVNDPGTSGGEGRLLDVSQVVGVRVICLDSCFVLE